MDHLEQYVYMAAFGMAGYGIWRLNGYAKARFDHHFFGLASFALAVCAFAAMGLGLWIKTKTSAHGISLYRHGCIVAAAGALAYAKILYCNFRHTNVLVGIAGTLAQLILFALAAVLCIIPLLMSIPLLPFMFFRNLGASDSPQVIYRPMTWYSN